MGDYRQRQTFKERLGSFKLVPFSLAWLKAMRHYPDLHFHAGPCCRHTNKEVTGLAALKAKSQWWVDNHEIHSAAVTGPWPNGDRFIVGFQYDVTHKPSGQRIKMEEAALYTVENGKIVREEFFYAGGA